MEEINQNQQIPQPPSPPNPPTPLEQPSEQPSKNWLIKSLLTGILGGILVGVGIGLFAAGVAGFIMLPPPGGELLVLFTVGMRLMIFAFLGWVVFFILTLYLGYCHQRGIPLGWKSLLIKFLFLVAGMGWGWLVGIGIQLYLGEFPGIPDRTYSFLIRGITSLLGALFSFKLSKLFIPKTEIGDRQSSTRFSPKNPSKNWLIRYLLIGIFGGIPFGIIMGIIASLGSFYWMFATAKEPLNLGAIAAALVFYVVAPIAATTFFTFTIFVGYRRHVVSYLKTKSSPILVELLFLLIGGSIGYWYLTFMFADFLISLNYYGLIRSEVLIFANITLGAYVFFKFSRLLLRQEAFSSWIKQPLVWVSLVYILLVVIVAPLNWKKNQELSQEGKLLDLSNLQSSVALNDSFGEDGYRIEITAQLKPSPIKNRYQVVAANLDSSTEGCPSYGGSSGADIHPGDSQVTITFLKSFLTGSPPEILPTSCSYDFSYGFDLIRGEYRTFVRKNETGLALHQTITIPFGPQGSTPGISPNQDNLPESAQRLVNMAKDDLSQKLGIRSEGIKLLTALDKEWQDAYLGCTQGEIVNQIATSGWQFLFEVDGKIYDYRTDQIGVKQCLATSGQSSASCTKDSDCPEGLVCTGRGPTQPSTETPGVCVSSKASQAVQ